MKIQINLEQKKIWINDIEYQTGCSKCKKLEELVKEMVGSDVVTKVEDIIEIMNYGVMSTPALVIDEKVVVSGRIPTKEEIKKTN